MSVLHTALANLGPIDASEFTRDPNELQEYIQSSFASAKIIIDSVPPPPPPPPLPRSELASNANDADFRSRSSTLATSVSDLSISSTRSKPLDSSNIQLQKEWGKAVKLSAKETALGMTVHKLSGKDGRGAWFARRSVHDGLDFDRWQHALEREFPESLAVQGGPGEGNIRGIGAERVLQRLSPQIVSDAKRSNDAKLDIYHLSAQFPGPTAPRDFVEVVTTSAHAFSEDNTELDRHYLVISRPCNHPDSPPRDGFVRGTYESIEFIRRVPQTGQKRPTYEPTNGRKSVSYTDLGRLSQSEAQLDNVTDLSKDQTESAVEQGRARATTISYGPSVIDEIDYSVEWIMVTRSDPGGSVPRFMVERGTPSGIVSDAGKFLDWAVGLHYLPKSAGDVEPDNIDSQVQNHDEADQGVVNENTKTNEQVQNADVQADQSLSNSSTSTSQSVRHSDRNDIDGASSLLSGAKSTATDAESINSSIDSFASAEEVPEKGMDVSTHEDLLAMTTVPDMTLSTQQSLQKDFGKVLQRKTTQIEKSTRWKEKELSRARSSSTASAKHDANAQELYRDTARLTKIEQTHSREVAKAEERYSRDMAKLNEKRAKMVAKEVGQKLKSEEKTERHRLRRDMAGMKAQMDVLKRERDQLLDQVGTLRKENVDLTARIGQAGR